MKSVTLTASLKVRKSSGQARATTSSTLHWPSSSSSIATPPRSSSRHTRTVNTGIDVLPAMVGAGDEGGVEVQVVSTSVASGTVKLTQPCKVQLTVVVEEGRLSLFRYPSGQSRLTSWLTFPRPLVPQSIGTSPNCGVSAHTEVRRDIGVGEQSEGFLVSVWQCGLCKVLTFLTSDAGFENKPAVPGTLRHSGVADKVLLTVIVVKAVHGHFAQYNVHQSRRPHYVQIGSVRCLLAACGLGGAVRAKRGEWR
ncbi:hypothetical protein E2C01_018161 [Portunus trituberculatus]|uniref:Uncharacterized protein n=1 Tax=Portunus trituberculatus TaxID=210409 RepID=A0A5B7DTT3_PORTR|nr:hypothetical protein [Portunus trituberculatus]